MKPCTPYQSINKNELNSEIRSTWLHSKTKITILEGLEQILLLLASCKLEYIFSTTTLLSVMPKFFQKKIVLNHPLISFVRPFLRLFQFSFVNNESSTYNIIKICPPLSIKLSRFSATAAFFGPWQKETLQSIFRQESTIE